ncbi:vWA domain-containing protein [Verminephrobacter aporrectodeae]|uniref:vWA domain-containing protein n=1 Tax=Verminephrobacter aporrectodeae TaxID=1110389 RepID=UPI0002376546|nr:vWA domain-containing protein [Verminephrobacter aporrectodeae]MCW8165578.1 VWA domain-containing protein [Verminephrobacter aporrectodeae subsp. tuberculatae]MCW8169589.1 VWA domain-containing protein [Verminephrobacter aporrectodeae subsp. tuberculatae]MCW8176144.1 VWA domain-containing protein [Verminephrobacter aporrectodeae subsp. tuberculatae]MCW8203847.1 VWA domain-containing protein [Verminephrobacter aporrectodeae subsp. tuberculatae]
MRLDFAQPWVLALLPLALLPLLRRRRDTLRFSCIAWLPADPVGRALGVLWRSLACAALAGTLLGLAGPGQPGAQLQRTGRGAEVLILLDRSSSMDASVHTNGLQTAGRMSHEPKAQVVRELLGEFVSKRPDDRFAFMTFSTVPIMAVPFTHKSDTVQAALAATAIGRGLPETRMGDALLAAIDEFAPRSYSGSRVILIVSDGGAQLDEATRRRIRAGLAHEKIALYWIYVRSGPNAPNLDTDEAANAYGLGEELALHAFFKTLGTPYRLYQADDSNAIAAAMAEIDRQQNFPLTIHERVPRRDHAGACYLAALACCAALLAFRALQWQSWEATA